jgi:hypothetical protein
MSPLDLTRRPPRSPEEELRGVCMLPRMIDIARAKLPGGDIGQYQIGRGLSRLVLAHFRISDSDFVEIVRESETEDAIADRLWHGHGDANSDHTKLSRVLRRVTVADVPADLRNDFDAIYGRELPRETRIFDVLIADDTASFART